VRRYFVGFFSVAALLSAITFWLAYPIAPQFTGNVSFDQKLMFVRDHLETSGEKITLVVGSSMALNNVDTDILTERLVSPYFDLGVWGMSIADAHRLADQIADRYPTRDIILSTQFFELRDEALTNFTVTNEVLDQYLNGTRLFGGFAQRDFYESLKLRRDWVRTYANPNSYVNMQFNRSGAVPLDISADERDPVRWLPVQDFPAVCASCMDDVEKMCQDLGRRGIGFSVVLPPLTQWVRDQRPEVNALYLDRKERLRASLRACNAPLFDADEWAAFDDSCFADFSHLNREGTRQMSDMVVLWRQGEGIPTRGHVTCKHQK